MTEKLQQTIKEEIAKLPKEAQEAINSFDWIKVTNEVGVKFLLSENEINNFQVETLLILTGIERGESYPLNIENNVGTSKEEAEKMADEVFEKVFTPINNIFAKNIKKSGKSQKANPEQTIDFILSGGDYSAFADRPVYTEETQETGVLC